MNNFTLFEPLDNRFNINNSGDICISCSDTLNYKNNILYNNLSFENFIEFITNVKFCEKSDFCQNIGIKKWK